MKTLRLTRDSRCGKILVVTLFVTGIIGIVLVSALTLIKSQNQAVARSQAWNQCIPIIEAGIEEALAHLNNPRETSLAVSPWTQNGSIYWNSRPINGDSFFDVYIINTNPSLPVIVCTGYVRLAALVAQANPSLLAAANVSVGGNQYIARAVQVNAKRTFLFVKGMVAKERITMNGNTIATDSYDSSDTNYCTPNGTYDPAKNKDNGDVSTISGLDNALSTGNANIKGRLRTGPGGIANVGANGTVGSKAWVDGGRLGIQPGWFSDDLNISLPDVDRPSDSGSLGIPVSGTAGTNTYRYLLGSGTYVMSSLTVGNNEKLGVSGKATLIVDGSVTVSGGIDILPGGTLALYVAGPTADIGGSGVNNSGSTTNFLFYGLPTLKSLTLPSNGDFCGGIYAPSTDFQLSGGGTSDVNFCGACVARTVKVNGHYLFHYDEALSSFGPPGKIVITAWVEL
jgi:hypothetical protein